MGVHIFGVGGAKPIKDATATPNDVMSGKVFYNNDGRQVGSFVPISEKTLEVDTRDITEVNYESFSKPKTVLEYRDVDRRLDEYKRTSISYYKKLHIPNMLVLDSFECETYYVDCRKLIKPFNASKPFLYLFDYYNGASNFQLLYVDVETKNLYFNYIGRFKINYIG